MASPKSKSSASGRTTRTKAASSVAPSAAAASSASASSSASTSFVTPTSQELPPAPVASSIFEGLPAPEELAKYEKIVPGGAERLIELAEQRAAHQQASERRALEAEVKANQVRTVIGFILALSTGVLGGMLLLQGSELAGLILILIDAAALVGITVYGRRNPED